MRLLCNMMLIMMFVPTVKKYGENLKKCKHKADKKMVKALDAVPYKQRQWGHAAARHTINAKQKLGLGLRQQKGTGVLDEPLDVVKFAETLTKKMIPVLSCVW